MKTLKTIRVCYLIIVFLTTIAVSAQTYTTVQPGSWTSAATWDANGVPPIDLNNDTVNINHRVEINSTLKLQGNTTLNINYILRFLSGGNLEMETTSDVLNINFGLLVLPNGTFTNKAGTLNLNYGRVQLCNSSYKDESNSPQGTFGIGAMYADNGSIDNVNPGDFSSNIDWCVTGGSGINLPIAQNCARVAPPAGFTCLDELLYEPARVDFDGIDDFLDSDTNLSNLQNATLMAWVQLSPTFSNQGFVVGQDNFNISVNTSRQLVVNANGSTITLPISTTLPLNIWTHITAVYQASHSTKKLRVYINGEKVGILNSGGTIGSNLATSISKFTIGKTPGASLNYFKGAIDEVRAFDVALTDSQLRQMIHQEIKNEGGNIAGVIIPKTIADQTTKATLAWSSIIAYYPMTYGISNVLTFDAATLDHSNYINDAVINNITTRELQTAPMPYKTVLDGDWTTEGTWLHGDVWSIDDITKNMDWSVVHVKNNVSTNNSHSLLGLIVDSNKTITVNDDNVLTNSWYLELNGTINLKNDSQLVQTNTSDLITSADGKILRHQEGTANMYWYNYFGSPVGNVGATSLTDNNTASNNANNSTFNIDMLKDGTGSDIKFTSSYGEVGKVSTIWFYTFQNGTTYWDWNGFATTTPINPGVGYIHKGTGVAGTEQQYIFEGKPNNGTILINATDTGGPGSVPAISKTDYLLGNPYPSALDIHKFIDDNVGVIDGSIKLWQQWSGNSHYLNEYDGGYAIVNKLGSTKAYQFVGMEGANGSQDGTLSPTRYLPVGQGFMAEIIADGNVIFNNDQRIFIKESDADGTYNNGSVFFRSSNSESTANTESTEVDATQILRLEFGVSNGASRSFVIGFTEDATDGYDYGLDGGLILDPPADDMGSLLDGQQYVIQAFAPYTPDKEIDLVLHASGNFTYTLKSTEISNFPVDQDLFIKDLQTGQSYDLRSADPYNFTSVAGSFTDRFKVVFQDPQTLSAEDFTNDNTLIYVNQLEDKLHVKALEIQAKQLSITNLLGQRVKTYNNLSNQALENGINISDLNTGVYLIRLTNNNDQAIDKKVIID